MGNLYISDIDMIFTIEVEHKIRKDEIEKAGGVSEALKLLGEELVRELSVWYMDHETFFDSPISIYACPAKRKRNHKYMFSFIHTDHGCPFNEEEVDLGNGKLMGGVCDQIENEWKYRFTTLIYPVKNFEVIAGEYYDIIKGEELNPDKTAIRLEAMSK